MVAGKKGPGARPVAKKRTVTKQRPVAKKPAAIRKPAAAGRSAAKKPAAAGRSAAKKPAAAGRSAAKKPPAAKARAQPPAAVAYGSQVAKIIAARARDSSYRPEAERRLAIARRRLPRAEAELAPDEIAQLRAIWHPTPLGEVLADEEYEVEVAEVVDEGGALHYRLYAWNYGVGYLMPPSGYDVVAFGAQHDLEHWRPSQREVFFALDHALRANDHGFSQPLSFCWWREECWAELEGKAPGEVGSEPHLRAKFAAVNAAG